MRYWIVVIVVSCGLLSQARSQELKVFFGNLHSHTAKSDGSGTPEQAYKYARDRAKIHFLMLSEHNHRLAPSKIEDHPELYSNVNDPSSSIATANRLTQDDRFVALYGQEFSTHGKGNHINVFDIPNVIPSRFHGKFDELLEWLARSENLDTSSKVGLIQFNHPWAAADDKEYGRNNFATVEEWVRRMNEHTTLIEVVNGPHKKPGTDLWPAHVKPEHFITYLNHGFRLAPTANQDNHLKTWGNSTTARTGILAPRLTKTDLIAALRARHVFATTDVNLAVTAKVGSALMGDVVDAAPMSVGQNIDLRLTVFDAAENPSQSTVHYIGHVYSDDAPGGDEAQMVEEFEFEASPGIAKTVSIDNVVYTGPGQYLFVELQQLTEDEDDADMAWTAPFWFEPVIATPPTGGINAGVRIVSLLPNSASPEGETEEITLRNNSPVSVNLQGWRLRDSVGATWVLDSLGMIAPGASETIRRNGQPMSLNNGGDTVSLINPDGIEVHRIMYNTVAEGERVNIQ